MADALITRRLRLVATGGVRCSPISDRPPIEAVPRAPRSAKDVRTAAIACAIEDELRDWSALAPETESARRVDVSCHVALVADGEHWVGHTETLGARGAFVASYLLRPVGTRIRARIELPTAQTIEVVAAVAGHRPAREGSALPPGMQLAFDEISPESERRLAELLHTMSVAFWRRTS